MSEPPAKQQKTDDNPPDEPDAPMERAGDMQSSVSKETPIIIPPTITYGLQDTHTTIIPVVFWLSLPNLRHDYNTCFGIRLNSPWQILTSGTLTQGDYPAPGSLWSKKVLDKNYLTVGPTAQQPYHQFPEPLTSINPTPWWRTYWLRNYSYYTVLNCEYEIEYHNPCGSDKNALIAHTIETSGNASARKLPAYSRLSYLYGQKNIQYKQVHSYDYAGDRMANFQTIYGNYKPGQAKKDVSNDGEVKLWTPNGEPPPYVEQLQLLHYQAPLSGSNLNDNQGDITTGYNLNVQVRLKYTVQYKQLKEACYYPMEQVSIATTLPVDATTNL